MMMFCWTQDIFDSTLERGRKWAFQGLRSAPCSPPRWLQKYSTEVRRYKYVQKSTNKYKSAPVEPTMVAKSPTGFFHQSGIMMDQFARGFVQKLCMLLCQKIIRWRWTMRTIEHIYALVWPWCWTRREAFHIFILGTLNLGMWPRGPGSRDPGGGLDLIIPIFSIRKQLPPPSNACLESPPPFTWQNIK